MTLRTDNGTDQQQVISTDCAYTPVESATSPGHGALGALKARATLAWGEAPGTGPVMTAGLKARAKFLIPHKTLVEDHSIFCEQRSHLALVISPLMMSRLIVDVSHQRVAITQANRKSRVSTLPSKPPVFRALAFDPLRRRHFQPAYQRRHRLCPGKEQCNVDMIGHAAHAYADILRSVHQRRQVRVHLASYAVLQHWPAIFRTEYKVDQDVRQRLRHTNNSSADLQSANMIPAATWGFAPGYLGTGLQPVGGIRE